MKTVEMLLAADYLTENELAPDLETLHGLVVKEVNKSKNIVKLMSSVGVFAGMLSFPNAEIAKKQAKSLLFL